MRRILILAAAAAAGLLVWFWAGQARTGKEAYRFVDVERGEIQSTVSSTGTLQAITTVQVGTQVSGQIAEIDADFNDEVKKGQLIARIDPTLLLQEVRQAEASLERSDAELAQAKREMDRNERLYASKVVTESEYTTAQYQLTLAEASLKTAQIGLEKARRNLNYTEIRAPVDGVVLERNVDVGQTVAASLSAPQLFLIAGDLSQMEILASVDESDIGRIREGQEVRFTVQAYPDESFEGSVRQIRLQSAMQENVVSYTVAVSVPNTDGRLLPGMTATVEFIVERVRDVLKVANAAIRFRPTEEMLVATRGKGGPNRQDSIKVDGDSTRAWRGRQGSSGADRQRGNGEGRARLWYVDDDGNLKVTSVRTALSDGQFTAIEGGDVHEGMRVIAAVTSSVGETPANPFERQQSDDRRRPRPSM